MLPDVKRTMILALLLGLLCLPVIGCTVDPEDQAATDRAAKRYSALDGVESSQITIAIIQSGLPTPRVSATATFKPGLDAATQAALVLQIYQICDQEGAGHYLRDPAVVLSNGSKLSTAAVEDPNAADAQTRLAQAISLFLQSGGANGQLKINSGTSEDWVSLSQSLSGPASCDLAQLWAAFIKLDAAVDRPTTSSVVLSVSTKVCKVSWTDKSTAKQRNLGSFLDTWLRGNPSRLNHLDIRLSGRPLAELSLSAADDEFAHGFATAFSEAGLPVDLTSAQTTSETGFFYRFYGRA